jgi:sugar phosphate isomerase/epimerase
MKRKARKEHFDYLENVTTLAGASRLVKVDRHTISYAIDAGHIAARREGRNVLIYVPSLLVYFHFPVK